MGSNERYKVFGLPEKLDDRLLRKFAVLSADAIRAIRAERMILFTQDLLKRPDEWAAALQDPQLHHFILIAPNVQTGVISLEEGQWVGMYVFQGPLKDGEMEFYRGSKPTSNHETRWIGRRLFVQEHHRSQEATRILYQAEGESIAPYLQREEGGAKASARISYGILGTGGSIWEISGATGKAQAVREVGLWESLEADGTLDQVPAACKDIPFLWDTNRTIWEKVIEA